MDDKDSRKIIEEYKKEIEDELKGRIESTKNKDIKRKLELEYINERENILKQEKLRIKREQKWYKKPQNIITLLGVLLPIMISIIVSVSNQDSKELTVLYNNPESLISSESDMRGSLYVRYDSSEISNISKFSIQIINSGELTITKDDFIDGPICFEIKCKKNPKLKLLKVIRKDDANQQNSKLTMSSKSVNSFQYLPSLINKGDKIIIDVFLPNSPDIEFNSYGKLIEGEIKRPELIVANKHEIGFRTFILSINSFFEFKWLSVIVLITLFIFTALASLFQFVMLAEGELDTKVLGFFMSLSTTLISIFILVIAISILVY